MAVAVRLVGWVELADELFGGGDGVVVGEGVEPDRYLFGHDADGTAPWRPDYATLAFGRLADRFGIAKIWLHDSATPVP